MPIATPLPMPTRPQLGHDQYHDLIAFQAFTAMQHQLALATREQELQRLAQQLTETARERDEWQTRATRAEQQLMAQED